jgi:DNA-binding PadR family transcriptional regulator
MSRGTIGEFEALVLLAILRVGEEAYGVPILEEIRRRTSRDVLRPAVYVALRRLEQKGLVRAVKGRGTPARGGRPRKFYEVAPEGLAALREARNDLLSMWDGLEAVLDRS